MAKRIRNNLAVGITVSIVLALTIYIVVTLAEWPTLSTPQQKITVRLPYKAGLKGLNKSSPIHLGGVKIGHITNTGIKKLNPASTDCNDVYVFFTMKIPQQYRLRRDCILVPESNVLGGQILLSIEDLGSKGEFIKDGQTVDLLLADNIMDAIKREFDPDEPGSFLARLKKSVPAMIEQFQQTVAKADTALDTAQSAMKNLEEITDNERIDRIISNISEISVNLKLTAQAINREFDPDEPGSFLAWLKKDIPAMIEQFQQTVAKANTALDAAQSAMKNLEEITDDERIDRIISNISEVSANLKLTAQEVRRAPWKLLYKPKQKEYRIQALIDSAGAFAAGAERLDSTALRLHKLMAATDDKLQVDKNSIESMISELEASFEQFQKVEQKFWEELK